ncbi:pectate lyase [Phenylobacterium sp.]|jgi:PelA/Pel-15E family pectate lyase|uniref:pectate lyase n=1 Tax=Phenylobacterium sp. TaxID=1871053 RepID=UPI002F941A43
MIRALVAVMAALLFAAPAAAQAPPREQVLSTMRKATEFMVEKVAYNGGYVWSYTSDFKRRWGELEAKPTMVWVQPPGTATMGHLFLDAYHATGDDYYYRAAEKAAEALAWGQHPSGGWNYLIDFAGEGSLQDWYDTYGKNAWRMEEFQHNWGNATFDDAGTSEAMQFLLRLYMEKRDPKWRPALDRAIGFVLDSQMPNGGWPQRWPPKPAFAGDYTGYITFNDDVAGENIKFLIMVHQALGAPRALPAVRRAMDSFVVTQQGPPQPGWGLQHGPDLKPAAARSYEPKAFATHTTASNLDWLMTFYELTGDTKYLARVGEGLDWLEKVKLAKPRPDGRTHPTFIEIGTDCPLYVHRRGSNIVNGAYYVDYSPERTLAHYSGFRKIDLAGMRRRLDRLKAAKPEEVTKSSPLMATSFVPLPKYFATRDLQTSDLNVRADRTAKQIPADRARQLVASLDAEGYWPTPLVSQSHPYTGAKPPAKPDGDYATTHVGDFTDTSPYPADNPPVGISTGAYIQNMSVLIDYLTGGR